MKDTVKVVIAIPKELYDYHKYGIPLTEVLNGIKTEIENRSFGIANDSVIYGEICERQAVLAIIDKHIDEESEEC